MIDIENEYCTNCTLRCSLKSLKCKYGQTYILQSENADADTLHSERDELLALMESCGHFLYHRRGGKNGQMRILELLSKCGEMPQRDLQRVLIIQAGSMSEIVAKMKKAGYLVSERDTVDKRKVILKITDFGRAEYKKYERQVIHQDLFEMLTPVERQNLKEALSKLLECWMSSDSEKYAAQPEYKSDRNFYGRKDALADS